MLPIIVFSNDVHSSSEKNFLKSWNGGVPSFIFDVTCELDLLSNDLVWWVDKSHIKKLVKTNFKKWLS